MPLQTLVTVVSADALLVERILAMASRSAQTVITVVSSEVDLVDDILDLATGRARMSLDAVTAQTQAIATQAAAILTAPPNPASSAGPIFREK